MIKSITVDMETYLNGGVITLPFPDGDREFSIAPAYTVQMLPSDRFHRLRGYDDADDIFTLFFIDPWGNQVKVMGSYEGVWEHFNSMGRSVMTMEVFIYNPKEADNYIYSIRGPAHQIRKLVNQITGCYIYW